MAVISRIGKHQNISHYNLYQYNWGYRGGDFSCLRSLPLCGLGLSIFTSSCLAFQMSKGAKMIILQILS